MPLLRWLAEQFSAKGLAVEFNERERCIVQVDGVRIRISMAVETQQFNSRPTGKTRLHYDGLRRVNRLEPSGGWDKEKLLAKILEDVDARKRHEEHQRKEWADADCRRKIADDLLKASGLPDGCVLSCRGDGYYELRLPWMTEDQVKAIGSALAAMPAGRKAVG